MDSTEWALLLGIGIGICAGGWYWLKHRNAKESSPSNCRALADYQINSALLHYNTDPVLRWFWQNAETVDGLFPLPIVLDEVNGAALAPWYREIQQKFNKNLVFFLCKITQETQTMSGIMNVPEELDCSHYLVQAAVDRDACSPVAIRLVSFCTMIPAMENLFAEKDFIILEG